MVQKALVRATAVAAFVAFLIPGAAAAATFNWTSGTVTISATAGADIVLASISVPTDGVFVEFDATGAGSLVDFLITIPTTSLLSLEQPYGGFDQFVVESASVKPGIGYTNLFNQDLGGGVYAVLASPLDIDGQYSAIDSTATNPPVSNIPVPFTDTSAINGTVNITLGTLELTGITITELPAGFFPGATDNLVVKADIFFTGMVVPEPGTGLLLGLGLLAVAGVRTKSD
jgi:hypothetical protein